METLDKLIINGNKPLFGEVNISGAKNAALPLMTISLLIEKGFELNNVPDLIDTQLMNKMINELGIKSCNKLGKIQFHGKAQKIEPSENLVKKMRASILILSPLLQSKKIARVPLPGGCAIGSRPIDIHLEVIKKLGATVEFKDNFLEARLPKMNFFGNNIKFPIVSVGATECAILAAVLAKGKTTLSNAAKEPEIVDLGNCLIKAGACINGLGESEITINGVDKLNPISYSVIADRIEAGSFAIAAAITKGNVNLKNVKQNDLEAFLTKLKDTGIKINRSNNEIEVLSNDNFRAVNISTEPHPGFPTDLQAQFMSLMCLASGKSVIQENIFENRFQHIPELKKMGANIITNNNKAFIEGKKYLFPAKVKATDLRASMCLILACLATKGKSEVFELEHLKRGYEDIENKLSKIGAEIN